MNEPANTMYPGLIKPSFCCAIAPHKRFLFVLAVVVLSVLVSRRGKAEGVEEAEGDPAPPREAVGRKPSQSRETEISKRREIEARDDEQKKKKGSQHEETDERYPDRKESYNLGVSEEQPRCFSISAIPMLF